MAPQYIYNLRSNYPNEGMYLRNAMEILMKNGICPEADYPYAIDKTPDSITPELNNIAKNYNIKSYARVNTIDELKETLIINGPCIICLPVYNKNDSNGRIWNKEKSSVLDGYHCMTIVGWTKKGFIIRNSWGRLWNGDGHCIYPYSDWGIHTEIWSAVDVDSKYIEEDHKSSCFNFSFIMKYI
jgi:hypothetical protein